MLELANYGAKMHPRSIELGLHYNIPIIIKSSFENGPGTIISVSYTHLRAHET